jgi:hypothetical protein
MTSSKDDVWLTGGNGIFRFAPAVLKTLSRASDSPLDYTSFGAADGMSSTQCSIGAPNIAMTKDHKLWVATVKGLAELDLTRTSRSNLKPTIFVTEVTVGRRKQVAGPELVLPADTHHTELQFDSISLKSPEKLKFQYRMDGIDLAWLDADSLLTAVYTNIPRGVHYFHVRACNSDGVWDPIGIVYRITQQSFFYETLFFRAGVVTAFALLLAAAYRLRLNQIAQQYNMRLDERVGERTRIARELHDTLLQSFHGLMLRFQVVLNILPEREERARELLKNAIDRAEVAITEGRDAVQQLRGNKIGSDDLVQALTNLGQEFTVDRIDSVASKIAASFRVLVEGTPRLIPSILRDDLYRIAREAV